MPFSSLVGNGRIKRMLQRAVAESRVEQGLIFAGPRGVGKFQFALALAQAMNCMALKNGDACSSCLSCKKMQWNEHPDVRTITPDGQFIKIAQMRELTRVTHYKGVWQSGSKFQIFIIDEADRLRTEAANAVLKTLEEPADKSLIILVTSKLDAIIPTIRSRCQIKMFEPLTVEELEQFLKENYKRPAEENRLLARLAQGSIGRALEIDLGIYREQRTMLVEMIEAAISSPNTLKLAQAAEYLAKKLEREEFERYMDTLLVLLADVFYLNQSKPVDSLSNTDIAPRLERIAKAATLEQIAEWAHRIEDVMRGLARNLNRQLAMEEMFLAL